MELNNKEKWFVEAGQVASNSKCLKAKCGSVIVDAEGNIIGQGYNGPAGNETNRCNDKYIFPENNKYDVTCCVHAEVRAIHDAMIHHPNKIKGATLYFMRVDSNNMLTKAGVPYCTLCSKEALDSGLEYFGLWHEDGIKLYNTKEYNNISYQFFKDQNLWKLK